MNVLLNENLQSLIAAGVGNAELRTPLLNSAGQLLGEVESSHRELQALMFAAPLPGLIAGDWASYWADLAPGTEVSRRLCALTLRERHFASKARLLNLCRVLSDPAFEAIIAALAAPQAERLFAVALRASDDSRVTVPGAVLIEADPGCVLVLPGLEQELFEFDDREQAGQALVEYFLASSGKALREVLQALDGGPWQTEPFERYGFTVLYGSIRQPLLAHGLEQSLGLQSRVVQGNIENWSARREGWFSRPLPVAIGGSIRAGLKRDAERQRVLMTFASIGPDIARDLVDEKLLACEEALLAYMGEDLNSNEHKHYRQVHSDLKACQGKIDEMFRSLSGPALPADFWTATDTAELTLPRQWVAQFGQALGHEAQLQVYEKTLSTGAQALLKQVISYPAAAQRSQSAIQVLEVSIGSAAFAWTLPGALIVTSSDALADQAAKVPVVFVMVGEEGGLREFESLQALDTCLQDSLRDAAFSPLWWRFPAKAREALPRLVSQAPLPLRLRAIEEDWLQRCFVDEVERATVPAPVEAEAALHRRLQQRLCCAVNEVRDLSIDRIAEQRRVQVQLQALPAWLQSGEASLREAYSTRLERFNEAAVVQEQRLQDELPLIRAFVGTMLKARIQADLKIDLDPEAVVVRMPVDVEVVVIQNIPSEQYKPSEEQESLTLVELAMLNIDRQVTLRLKFAQILDRVSKASLMVSGLTLDYLRKMIIELDVAQQYREKINEVFSVAPDTAADVNLRTQLMLTPYRLGLELEAFSLYRQGKLSAAGQACLEHAMAAREATALRGDGFDLHIYRVRLGLGGTDQNLLSRLILIEDRYAQVWCLYLPNVPQGSVFIERASRASVLQALLDRLSDAETLTWLAGQGGIRDSTPSREAYLNEARRRKFSGFVEFVPFEATTWPLAAALFEGRKQRLLEDASAESRSRADVRAAFARQLRDGGKQILMSGLGYLPGIGTALQLYDGWNDADAAINAFRAGDSALGLRRLASAELNLGFALASFIPGLGAARLVREAVRARQALRSVQPLHVEPRRAASVNFSGYEVDVSLVGAKAQVGADAGTWKQNGKLYLWQHKKAYEVFRRSGEQTLRLRPTATRGYAQPVRPGADGRFVAHMDVGGKGGGRGRGLETAVDSNAQTFKYEVALEHREVMRDLLKCAGKRDLDERYSFGGASARPGWAETSAFFTKRSLVQNDADAWLASHVTPARVELPTLPGNASHVAIIEGIYAKSNGLVVGEHHSSMGSKRFLIENMATFKEQGVKTLYFEHLLTDFDGADLQVLNSTASMPPRLIASLRRLDGGHRVPEGQRYTFTNVVDEASKQGIEVVAIDCAASYHIRGMMEKRRTSRGSMFSFYATRIISAHQASKGEHKWVALVGNAHTNTLEGVPGLAELNRGIGLRISDLPAGTAPTLLVDPGENLSTMGSGTPFHVKADLHLEVEGVVRAPGSVPASTINQALPLPSTHASLPLSSARLRRAGMFYIEKADGKRVIVHLSRDGRTYRTPVAKTLGIYSLSRPSWDKVHEKKFLTIDGLLKAMKAQGMTHVDA
jgi:hypothetical protein